MRPAVRNAKDAWGYFRIFCQKQGVKTPKTFSKSFDRKESGYLFWVFRVNGQEFTVFADGNITAGNTFVST